MNSFKKYGFILLVIPLSLLTAYILTFPGCQTDNNTFIRPDRLEVSFFNPMPQNHYMPFLSHIITNQPTIQRLYDTINALPPPYKGPQFYMCPINRGLEYHLRFFTGHSILEDVIWYSTGCQSVQIGKNDNRSVTEAFQKQMTQIIGIPQSQSVPRRLVL